MPDFDWNQLVTPAQWAQKLHELLATASQALSPPDSGAVDEAIAGLQAFIDHEPGYINGLVQAAKEGIVDVALADIRDALRRLADLQRQVAALLGDEKRLARQPAAALQARGRVLQAMHQLAGVRALPGLTPATRRQLARTLALLQQLRA